MGRPLSQATTDFVGRVSAPTTGRGAATWRRRFCVGVGGLRREAATHIVDRISAVASDLGLQLGRPGCQPRAFVLFAEDADLATQTLVRTKGRRFRIGLPDSDLGDQALADFLVSDQPVRWWQNTVTVNAETGIINRHLPGQLPVGTPEVIRSPTDLGMLGNIVTPSRLRNEVRDDLTQVIIIVDVDQILGIDATQLADYLAMIALAQINPEVDPGPYDSILSLFARPESAPSGLTDWDRAFLRGLYGAEQVSPNARTRLSAVADGMAHNVRRQQREPR
ncbi:hypothetical protein ACFPIE_04275 [Brevundimonas staleyi]|uniref:Uncharacterized protein n=1 Tax=Brevundimonas staleyi TaxID=74326 RepID=A0ABW0FP35_9CAUL